MVTFTVMVIPQVLNPDFVGFLGSVKDITEYYQLEKGI
jgi:hypothetical protein